MSGETLSQEQLSGLRAENDSAVLNVAGEIITVEAAGMSDAALQSRIETLSDEDRTFFEGVKNGIVDTGMDIVNAAQLAYKLTTDPNERAKFASSVGKITDALANEETRSEAIKLIRSELGDGLLEAFNNFGNDPDYYAGYLAGSVAAGGAISKLAKFGSVATKLDNITKIIKNSAIPERPSWRSSEVEITTPYEAQGYRPQISFKDGVEAPYGTKGSTRPEAYNTGHSIEVKNYNVETAQGRSNIVRNVANQAIHRAANLPKNTVQEIFIDIRGQDISREQLNQIISRIVVKSNGVLSAENITIVR